MTFKLYYHPFSSYSQKAVTAFYEKGLEYEAKVLDGDDPARDEFALLWPVGRFPVLLDGDRFVFEATGIIEYLDARLPEKGRLIPQDVLLAAEVRMWDRFFDNYVGYPYQRIVMTALGREADDGGDRWRSALETAYTLLDERMAGREWAAGETFSMADCAAAPHLLYADWTHKIPEHCSSLLAYRARLLERPSYARALDEARPYRHYFPLGAPEGRD